MKRCLRCGHGFEGGGWLCPRCGYLPAEENGFLSFLRGPGGGEAGYDPDFYPELAALERGNFWFEARNRLLFWILRRYFPDAATMLEIGCGTGFVLSALEKEFPRLSLCGSDLHLAGLSFAAGRVERARLFRMDARRIPFLREFDLVGVFDVLEHVEEDDLVLAQVREALKEGGGIMITVPQHPFLWSGADESARHLRRYRAAELKRKAEEAGFTVLRMTSFVSLPFPLMLLSRVLRRGGDFLGELRRVRTANTVMGALLGTERLLIRGGLSFPFGGSLLLAGRRA